MTNLNNKFSFDSAEEILKYIQSGKDLYNKESCTYVFVYNESGSICTYHINEELAKDLTEKSNNTGEYWSAFLGFGGNNLR